MLKETAPYYFIANLPYGTKTHLFPKEPTRGRWGHDAKYLYYNSLCGAACVTTTDERRKLVTGAEIVDCDLCRKLAEKQDLSKYLGGYPTICSSCNQQIPEVRK